MTHVVLIEDDPSMRHLLKIFLEMEQFKTTLIDHFEPNAVIAELQSSQADFLLMDVHLNGAGANGFLLKPYAPTDLLNWLRSKDSSLSN